MPTTNTGTNTGTKTDTGTASPPSSIAARVAAGEETPPAPWRLAWVVGVGGGVLMALEILASRVLAPHFGSSVYVWGSIISVFLAALSVGYVWGGRLADRNPTLHGLGRQIALAALTLGVLLLFARPAVAYLASATGNSTWGTLVVTTVLFGVPSLLFGFISPYAARLAVRDPARLGGAVGRLYALSTAGSLTGTLACTFAIVPYLELDEGLALLLALTAITALVAIGPEIRREWPTSVMTLLLLGLALRVGLTPAGPKEGILFEQMSPYQTIEVRDHLGIRTLSSDSFTHGSLDLETGFSAHSYPRMAAGALLLQPKIDSMLVLGLGAGHAGTNLQRYFPDMVIDFVDIDPAMAEVARKFFAFKDGPTRRVHIQDGRRFIDQAEQKWDYIYCDTYIGLSVPFHLTTREFLQEVRDHLEPGGVFGLNLAGSYDNPFPRAIYRTVREVFPYVKTFTVPQSSNLYLVASLEPIKNKAELLQLAQELDARHNFDLPLTQILELELRTQIDFSNTDVLVDDYAPTDHLIHLDTSRRR